MGYSPLSYSSVRKGLNKFFSSHAVLNDPHNYNTSKGHKVTLNKIKYLYNYVIMYRTQVTVLHSSCYKQLVIPGCNPKGACLHWVWLWDVLYGAE